MNNDKENMVEQFSEERERLNKKIDDLQRKDKNKLNHIQMIKLQKLFCKNVNCLLMLMIKSI